MLPVQRTGSHSVSGVHFSISLPERRVTTFRGEMVIDGTTNEVTIPEQPGAPDAIIIYYIIPAPSHGSSRLPVGNRLPDIIVKNNKDPDLMHFKMRAPGITPMAIHDNDRSF